MEEKTAIRSQRERLVLLGKFFEDLAHVLLGGNLNSSETSDDGDIENFELDAKIEVKGCDWSHFFLVFTDQLEMHLGKLGFPLSHCWYALFRYKNPHRRLSKETPTPEDLNRFLAAQTISLHVLDSAVIDAIRKTYGVASRRRRGEEKSVVKVNRTLLQKFEVAPRRHPCMPRTQP